MITASQSKPGLVRTLSALSEARLFGHYGNSLRRERNGINSNLSDIESDENMYIR
jgi:hypothetical protein